MRKILGIRREDVNKWERRAPLTPDAAKKLHDDHGISIYIQPSAIRIFPDDAFRKAGCVVSEDLSGCPVIIGIKEIPADILLPEKTYMFFSHTIKGQAHNMGMLKRLMDSKCNLIDYEMIKNEKGKRLVGLVAEKGEERDKFNSGETMAKISPVDGKINLRILVDRPSIEIYANKGRIYMPMQAVRDLNNKSLKIYSKGGNAYIEKMTIYEMNSIWP